MTYLVVLNQEGLQAQYKLGQDFGSMKDKIKNPKDRGNIVWVFTKYDGSSSYDDLFVRKGSSWNDPLSKVREEIASFSNKRLNDMNREIGGHGFEGMHGYNLRKTTIGNPYIEIKIEMEEDEYNEAMNDGYDGLIHMLHSTTSLMHPKVGTTDKAAKLINKWVKRYENEKELEDM